MAIKNAVRRMALKIANMGEISYSTSAIYKRWGITDYNPDDLVGKKGLTIYEKMKKDDQIKATLSMKKMARLATSWDIISASTDPRDKEAADFVRSVFKNLKGTFEDNLFSIYSALDFGFSLTELVWKIISKGKWTGKIGLRALKTREPFNYNFDTDDHGRLAPDGIVFGGALTEADRFPIDKFVIFSYNKEFDNWYGTSDLRAAYRSWWSKEIIIRFHNIFLERFGMPTIKGTYKKGTPPGEIDKLREVLKDFQAKYSITLPEDITVDLMQATMQGEAGYRSAIEMHNKFIARSILVPDLLGFTESAGGSYALGKKHFDVFLWVLKKLGRDTEETIVGEQIIKPLVDMNFEVDEYPQFKFESLTEEDTEAKARIVRLGVDGGFIDPNEDWVRRYLNLPQKPEGLILIRPTEGRKEGAPIGKPQPIAKAPIMGRKGAPEGIPAEETWTSPFAPKKFKLQRQPEQFEKKINFQRIERNLDAMEQRTIEALSGIVRRQRDALIQTVLSKEILERRDSGAVNKLQLPYVGVFKRVLEQALVKLHLDAKLEALKDLNKGGVETEITVKFLDVDLQGWEPIPPSEALDLFNRKVLAKIVLDDGTKKLITFATGKELSFYSQRALAIAGVERDYILKEAKMILLEGIKSQNYKETMSDLRAIFDKYLETGELKEGELVTPHRLETIVRTNESEAVNMGRQSLFTDPDVVDFVPYLQWSSIIDSRTTDYCRAMDGKIFRRDDPDFKEPPAHYNCRSIVVPITRYEVEREVKAGRGIETSKLREVEAGAGVSRPVGFTEEKESKEIEIR